MGEMKIPSLLGLSPEERDAALFEMVRQSHDCGEERGRAAQLAHKALSRRVGRMERGGVVLQQNVRRMMLALHLEEPEPGEERPRAALEVKPVEPQGIAAWSPKKLIGWVAGVIGLVVATIQGVLMAVQATDWASIAQVLERLGGLVR